MQLLKDRIRKDGVIKDGNVLKVDSFLNHQMDIALINEMGKEFRRRFPDESINKILTIEASGIGIACITAQYFNCPVVFAKKTQSINIDGEVYSTKIKSFTHGRTYDVIVKKAFLSPAMGAENLEEGEFEPFFEGIESKLSGKKVALFGSYGWGDGDWMREWAERVRNDGAVLVNDEGLIANETPDDAALADCKALGAKLAE